MNTLRGASRQAVDLLFKYVADEDANEVQLHLKSGPEINILDADQRSPLHLAIEKQNYQIYKLLLDNKVKEADVNFKGDDGNTPLHFATLNFEQNIMQDLCARPNIKIDERNEADETPLHFAIVKDKRKAAILLLHSGADINAKNGDGAGPIHKAIKYGRDDIAKLLLNDPKLEFDAVVEKDGSTALSMACELGNEECTLALISRGAAQIPNPNNQFLPIHVAAQCGFLRLVKKLQETYPDSINAKTKDDEMLIHLAAQANHFHIIEYLTNEHQMDVNVVNNKGFTPLHLAASNQNARESVEILIANGADINALTNAGMNALHCAANANSSGSIQLLVSSGMDINGKSNDNQTPLQVAVKKGNASAAGVLIGLGANLDPSLDQLANQLPGSPDKQSLIDMLTLAKTDRGTVTVQVLLREMLTLNKNVSNVRKENQKLTDKNKEIQEKMKNIKHNKGSSLETLDSNIEKKPTPPLEDLDTILEHVRSTKDFKNLLPYLDETMRFTGAQKTQDEYKAEIEDYEKEKKIFEVFEEFLRGRLEDNEGNDDANNQLDTLRRKESELKKELDALTAENEMLKLKQDKSREIKGKILKMNECMKCKDSGPMSIYECGHVFCKDDSRGEQCPNCGNKSKAIAIQNDADPNAPEITEQAVEQMLEELIRRDSEKKEAGQGGAGNAAGDKIKADQLD